MKYFQTNRFGSFIVVGIMVAFLVSCKKNDTAANDSSLKTPLVTSVDIEQLQSSTLLTRYSLLLDYSGNYLTKVHTYQDGAEVEYAQYEYGTIDNISYIEHRVLHALSPYNGGSTGSNVLTYRETFSYNQDGNLDTYTTRSYSYGNGYSKPSNEYTGNKESYTYNSDGSVSVKVYTLFSSTGSSDAEIVKAVGSKVISRPSVGVKKVVITNTANSSVVTYTYNYDSKNNPFKNIAGSFKKLWVTPNYGVNSYDNGVLEDSGALGDIFSENNLLNFNGDNNQSGTFSYTCNSSNYPTKAYGLDYRTLTYHYNQ